MTSTTNERTKSLKDRDALFLKGLSLEHTENIEKKGKFSYLSWPFAFAEVKKIYPNAQFAPREFVDWARVVELSTLLPYEMQVALVENDMLPTVPYLEREGGSWVCIVLDLDPNDDTVAPLKYWFPILDNMNQPISHPNSFEVNTSIQRGAVKAEAVETGVGLYIYAGEDLPDALAGPQLASEEAVAAFKKLLAHPSLKEPIAGRSESRFDLLMAKYGKSGWVKSEMAKDGPVITKFIGDWERDKAKVEGELSGLKAEAVASTAE